MTQDRDGSLLAWQWSLYPAGHRNRRNLVAHALTVPLFQLGTVAVLVAPITHGWVALVGLGLTVGAMAVQGRTHRLERTPPVPFRGAGDVVARIVAEQWLTFPRYVASGGFSRAWRGPA